MAAAPGRTTDLDWLKAMKEQSGSAGEVFVARWKTWCAANSVQGMAKHQWVKAIASFRREYEADTGGRAGGRTDGTQAAVATLSEDESNALASSPLLTPTPWLQRAASAARGALEKAHQASTLRKEALSDRARLVTKGREAVRVVLRKRVVLVAGGLFSRDGDVDEIELACCCASSLAAAFRLMRLDDLLSDTSPENGSEAIFAIYGELEGSGDPAACVAQRALADLVFLIGTGMALN